MTGVFLKGVGRAFGSNTVLRDVSFHLQPGEFVGLVGPSGGGKSVLLKILGKVTPPSWGVIEYRGDGEADSDLSVGFLFQEGALFDSMSVIDNVAFPLTHGGATRDGNSSARCSRITAYERAFEILREVGLAKAYQKLPGQLSGGMRRRVGIARALVNRPDLVLLDDPTGGLDPVAARVIIDLIQELHQHYRPTVVLVSHDIRRLLPSVERVLGLFDGRIRCDVAPQALRAEAPTDVVAFLATRFDFDEFGRGAEGGMS